MRSLALILLSRSRQASLRLQPFASPDSHRRRPLHLARCRRRSHRRDRSRRRSRPRRYQRRCHLHRATPATTAASDSPHPTPATTRSSFPSRALKPCTTRSSFRTVVICGSKRIHAHTFAAPLRIVLPIAAVATNVRVTADSSEDLTAPEDNHDSSVMTSDDLKALPIFDNDYATAMSAFLDDSATATGGTGLIVDGVEANRATVSPSAVQEVRINQDPYSAQYYWPGRGQMEIITKSAADHYHGQFNFYFRDSALNAQNALAPSKPFEQRRIYEGHRHRPHSALRKKQFPRHLQSRRRRSGRGCKRYHPAHCRQIPRAPFQANVPAPTRDTEFSLRAAHQFGETPLRLRAIQLRGLDRAESGCRRTNPRLRRVQQRVPRRRHDRARRLHAYRPFSSTSSPLSANTTSATTSTPLKLRASPSPATSPAARRRTTRSRPSTTSASTTWPPGPTAATWSKPASASPTSTAAPTTTTPMPSAPIPSVPRSRPTTSPSSRRPSRTTPTTFPPATH